MVITFIFWLLVNLVSEIFHFGFVFHLYLILLMIGDNYFNATRDWSLLNFKSPLIKHTVNVPAHRWLAIMYHVNNPGYWMFHCHLDFHNEIGMAMIMRDGGPGTTMNQTELDHFHHLVKPTSSRWCLSSKENDNNNSWPLWQMITVGGGTSVIIFVMVICICTRRRKQEGTSPTGSQHDNYIPSSPGNTQYGYHQTLNGDQ
jgi:hypothetical protein